jgi:ferric-dicitrate binding protein FerR (iron transport regulator)
MSQSFQPIDAATIAALNGGDERALERIFREHHAVLLERAQERLKGEPAAAPRLVAATIRELWEERDGFHTSAEIEGFLNEELRQRAKAARARMAAVHRFEKNEGVTAAAAHAPPTVDQLWADIAKALHAPAADRETRRKELREHAAHEAASHIAHVGERRSWRTPAILITVAAAGLLGGYFWAARASERSVITQLLAAADAQVVTTRAGQLGAMTLADGSNAKLGADSRLVIVKGFGTEYRTAGATGAASIEVAGGKDRPLEVRLGEVSVTAASGALAVRDYPDEMLRYVRASAAGAEVAAPTGSRTLAEGQTVVVARDGTIRDATEAEVAEAFSWLDDKLVLRDVTVGTTLQQLWRWYGVDITVKDSAVLSRRLSLAVPLESSQAAISAVEGAAMLRFAWEQNKMTFRDAAPRNATRR